ncbi:MAG TPA: T9SS type A sorting domain-containing protein, partial [candidate division Zixibacteria bacterium]|nr:T9SS type A sorting domain-containing protein [candidate division Zixibacteria bacterium]
IPFGNKIVKNSSSTGRRWQPSLNFNASNEYMLSWSEFAVDNSDIHLNIFDDSHNSILSNELKANDDSLGAISINPQMAVSTDWYNLIVFEDRRNDAGDIYIQTISNAGIRLYSNIKVNQDNDAVLQTEPAIAASIDLKKSLVTWVDNRDINAVSGQRIFARFGTEFGLFSENEFLVSDSLQTALKKSPQAAINSSGKALIVWLDKRLGRDHIYGQWIASNGSLDGADFMVSDSLSDSTITDLQVAVDNSSNFYVTYVEKQQTPRVIKSIQFLGDGSLGAAFTKEFPVGGIIIEQSAVAVKSNGNIIVIFGVNDTYRRLYLAEYSSAGVELTAPFEILDMTNIDAVDPYVAVSNNDYVSVTWVDTRNGNKEIYTQLFDNLLTPINGNNKVSVDSPEFMQTPVTTAHNGRVWYSWADPRANGLNIYANNSIYLATDIDDSQQNIPSGFELIQNYPNPFNPSTEIAFRLPEKAFVTISVYNMLGQHVKTLVESDLSAGVHKTTWDATNQFNNRVASGIYFYKMETEEFIEMKKMMLLK